MIHFQRESSTNYVLVVKEYGWKESRSYYARTMQELKDYLVDAFDECDIQSYVIEEIKHD
jgi:hypothetical protein